MVNTENVTYLEIPDKSENDKKHYKTLVLANGLRALLVSDPSPFPHDGLTTSSSSYDSTGDSCAEETSSDAEDKSVESSDSDDDTDSEEGDEKLAACALLVDVGSFSEPTNYQGLAHFLEHMIFMGSEKYPAENAFDVHIKKCGGFDNANTDAEETLFYFEVSEEHLDSSIDYFAALLKAPLMKKEAMTRERDAVESEFQQTLHDDEARRDQLLASLARKDYPHSTFSWGNLKSLKEQVPSDNELHRVLHEFRKRHYSGHRMVVCVQARLPIDELESMVVKHFSDIPSNNLNGIDFSEFKYHDAFCEDFHSQVFFVKPVDNVCKLELTWVLPPMPKLYKCKPNHFLSHLIGYEGEGSLCAYLRNRLWGLELIAGFDESGFDSNSLYSLFNVCIVLTENGFKNLDKVLDATFAFMKLFSQSKDLKSAYSELQDITATNFRFMSQCPAFDNVQTLVLNTKYFPPKHILTGTEIYFEYNEEQIRTVIEHLNEFKFNIMITSQQKYEDVTYDKQEQWFGTEYTSRPMPEAWRDLWQNSKPIAELFLPQPNRFVTNDFRLFWEESGRPDIPFHPKKILQTHICELWFRQDDRFHLPEAFMYFYFISPLLRQNPKNDIMCGLLVELVKFRLVEELYPATVAALSYDIYDSNRGIVLKVSGFNEKLHLLVDIITKEIVSIREHISEEQLNVFKIQKKKEYFNALIKPKALNNDIRHSITERYHWMMIDKYKCLNEITLANLLEFTDKFTNQLYVQTLMQGNLTEEAAHNVMNSVLSTLNCQNIKEVKYIENRTVQLPQGAHFIRCNALNDADINTVICNLYQIGPSSVRIKSILDLLMMFVDEPLFDTLRTKEQLGYSVFALVRVDYGIASYSICVHSQESKFSAAHVEERIEVFRSKMLEILDNMPDAEFNHVRESLIKIKQVIDMSLLEEVNRNWDEISSEDYLFDRKRKEIEVLRTLTKQDIIEFCLNNERTNLRKMSVQVIGNTITTLDNPKNRVKRRQKQAVANVPSELDNSNEESDREETDDEELFNALANKLNLTFLPKEGDATTIVDINDFKENLHVYPVTRTKLEDNVPSNGDRSAAAIIEDC